MIKSLATPDFEQAHRLRLNTLIRLRWLAIVGQSVTVLTVAPNRVESLDWSSARNSE